MSNKRNDPNVTHDVFVVKLRKVIKMVKAGVDRNSEEFRKADSAFRWSKYHYKKAAGIKD